LPAVEITPCDSNAAVTDHRIPQDFEASYSGTPPWDIGRAQPVFVRVADSGTIQGSVLDAGCGSGENALMLAGRGFDVSGFDFAPTAIEQAQRKASERSLPARFFVWDALRLAELGDEFDTVIDSGLFHVFDDGDRAKYVEALGSVVRSGGRFVVACFSDLQPGDWGPRRVRQEELRASFADGWRIESIEATQFETNLEPPIAEAWLATITRL
jgi:SAM-dependent methyltransferase